MSRIVPSEGETPTIETIRSWINEALTPRQRETIAPIVVPDEWRDEDPGDDA